MYFNSDGREGFGAADIFVTHHDSADAPWDTPVNLGPSVNAAGNENACALSSDEHLIYFHSVRGDGLGGVDLYVARRHNRREDANWQPARNLGAPVNSPAFDAFPDYYEEEASGRIMLFFASNRAGGQGGSDIYTTTLQPDDTWSQPVPVPELNSPGEDVQPAVRKDGLELFLASTRPGSYGAFDIWGSTRASTADPWSTPVNLGPEINSPAPSTTTRPAISFDGTTLYFASIRPGGFGSYDIYVSTRTKLKE